MRARAAIVAFLFLLPSTARAEQPDQRRTVVIADVGYASTGDDEGLLGRGASLAGSIGYRLTPRLAVQGRFDRVRYYRDVEWLTFDGRMVFAGIEGSVQSRRQQVRPFVTFGGGIVTNDGVWIHKRQVGPGTSVEEGRSTLTGTFRAATFSGGVDVRAGQRTSIRPSIRLYGVFAKGSSGPYTIITPGAAIAYRW